MQLTELHVAAMLLGALLGGLIVWILLRARSAAASAVADSERRNFDDKLRHLSEQLSKESERSRLGETRLQVLQHALSESQRDGAQLSERVLRLQDMEALIAASQKQLQQAQSELAEWRDRAGRAESNLASTRARAEELTTIVQQREQQHAELDRSASAFRVRVAELEQAIDSERRQSAEKLTLLNEAREQLSLQFKSLANEILDEKSRKFVEQNQLNLGQLLNPLQEKIKSFQSKVEEVYVNESKDRSALAEQVRALTTLNNTLSADTQNLTLALKGDRKSQGNWGEIILDEVLEKSGLVEGRHYQRQVSIKTDDGQTHVIPDVVINLTGEKHLVVDSKFTLPDYRAFADADDDSARDQAMKRHLLAMRAHIKGLSEKNYQLLYGLQSMDFVVMFVPLEAAFMMAIGQDRELFQHAWEKNVLLVSPSTLLFVVRTVAHLWRQEDLGRNALEISRRGGELYDKLCGFVEDLDKVGERIQQAQNSYVSAKRKFNEGPGNLVRQAEMLRELGVKASKKLPSSWRDPAQESERLEQSSFDAEADVKSDDPSTD